MLAVGKTDRVQEWWGVRPLQGQNPCPLALFEEVRARSSAPSKVVKTPGQSRLFDDSGRLMLSPSRGRDNRSDIVRYPIHTQMSRFTQSTICQCTEQVRNCQAEEVQRIGRTIKVIRGKRRHYSGRPNFTAQGLISPPEGAR